MDTNEHAFRRKPASFWSAVPHHSVPKTVCRSRIALIALLAGALATLLGCRRAEINSVAVYAAQDQVYSEPILQQFTKATGIKVRAVYDSEAVKTVGLANRLLAERSRPQCDDFWGNEELRTRQLAAQNVFGQKNGWAAFGARSRRIVINTNLVALPQAPRSLLELTNQQWRAKVALAYPLFGTTATHFLALRQHWGVSGWTAWCMQLQANKPFLVDGNSVVVNMVGRGEAAVGLTDSDDIAAGQRNGLSVMGLPINEETLLIPNTVAVVRGAPNPENARKLFDYLRHPTVVRELIARDALEDLSCGEARPPVLEPNWNAILADMEGALTEMKSIFLR